MKKKIALLFIIASLGCTSHAHLNSPAGPDTSSDAIERYQKLLEANPDDATAYNRLREMLATPQVSDQQVKAIRELLHRYAHVGKASLASSEEPGDKLNITGKVKDDTGKAIAGATLYVFQTDATGHYSRGSAMNEGNPRLFAYMKSSADGGFEFDTIRPGGYPTPTGRDDEQNRIPQHIHLQITAAGYQFRNFEFVFGDDPRLTPYWRDWAIKRGHTILNVQKDSAGTQRGSADIILKAQ
ncbi:MAG TPA: hypothetical protein VGN86_14005 [Pyrinomonadaceae bacterium]|nr:hypothetical protein [Pyrinomonadaceae bacterium]